MPLEVTAAGFARLAVEQALQLRDADLKAVNTKASPDRIKPRPLSTSGDDGATACEPTLAPASWNVIRLTVA